ncbi:MAG: PEP-CTERM sorting domain-containing protein [Pirellulales bacterium]|nr:PEP-CTERM sorting domain-containing protein [Pirellulales bacterium]
MGHAPQEVIWTAPASVNAGGISISGAIEQLFEQSRVQRLAVFKNGGATALFSVDSLPPIVNGVVLQKVSFGPWDIAVAPGDTLKFRVDGSGAGGSGVPTFVAWDVTLSEFVIPEPATAGMLAASLTALGMALRRRT